MILLDTDYLSVLTDRRAAGNAALVRRLELVAEPLAIPIVESGREAMIPKSDLSCQMRRAA
jgi:hypothetical protein